MQNIIKALNYQVKRDIVTYIAIIVGALTAIIPIVDSDVGSLAELNGGLYSKTYLGIMFIMSYILACVIVACITGKDMGDKTINYEVMSGHSRAEVYFSRVVVSLVWDIAIVIVLSLLPMIIFTAINGWGNNITFIQLVPHYLINIGAALRMNCFVLMITSIMRHPVAGGFIAYGTINVSLVPIMILQDLLDIEFPHFLAMSDVFYLSELSNMRVIVEGGEKIAKYDMHIENSYAIWSIVIAVVVSAVYLLLGYLAFKKRDMR